MSAIIMCLSPSVLAFERAGMYFQIWGGLAALAGIALLFLPQRPLDLGQPRR